MALSSPFKPGLFNTGLNIEKKLSNHYLYIECEILSHYLKIEPVYMIPAIRNLQAVLLFNMDSTRTNSRRLLEELVKDFPKDLNALADLIYVYNKMGRDHNSERYKKQLESYKDDQLLQAKSILGQANALTYDLADDHNKSPRVLLKDTWRLLNMNDMRSEQVDRANNFVVGAYKVVSTIPETAHEKKIIAKEKAIERFEIGIEMLKECNCSKEEILVWKHNLAIARNRLETWENKRGADINSRTQNCIKVLEEHLDVIENLPQVEEALKIYVAKSYSYFAQVYAARKYYIDINQIPERIKKRTKDLDLMWMEAKQICPNDQIVLQRYARYLSNNSKYEEAIEIYNKSISLITDKYINWFSYSSRRDAYYYLCEKEIDKDKINRYLELAYKDGKLCLQSKCTYICMMQMARICFYRSMPDDESGVSFHCEDKEFIYEALEHIHEALKKRDTRKDGRIYSELGRCYPYIGEYRKAIESLKNTLQLNKWSKRFPQSFSNLCRCFLAFYEREENEDLLVEFRFMLKEAKKNKCDYWIKDAMAMMHKHNPEMLIHLVKNMIEWDVRGCEMLIKEALTRSVCQDLKQMFEEKLQETNKQESDVNGKREIQKLPSYEPFEYDFFVSHTEKDKDWVNSILRPELEDIDEEIKFKGCIPSRDFVPGSYKIQSMIDGIEKSCKILIVLTPNYLEDMWQTFYRHIMITDTIESKVKAKTIIPIILERCELPKELKIFTSVCFIENSPWDHLRMGLTGKLDPGLEEGLSALNIGNSDED